MALGLLGMLATGVLIASDSENIGNMDQIAQKTQFFWDPDFTHENMDEHALKNKKILLILHGYNNTFDNAIKSINEANVSISHLHNENGQPLYDLVIGYIWPGTDSFLDYGKAKQNTDELKTRVCSHLTDLHKLTPYIDIMAHSLGNRVALEALSFVLDNRTTYVRNFFSMAPAVDATCAEKGRPYYSGIINCQNMFVLHSDRDDVLKYVYPLTSFKEALGAVMKPNFKNLSTNIQFVDCSKYVAGHGYFFGCKPIYKFIQRCCVKKNPLPPEFNLVTLKKDGSVRKI